jgi:hypothetical protein
MTLGSAFSYCKYIYHRQFFKKNLGELYYSKANKSLVTITPTLLGAKLENCSSLD